MAIGRRSFDCAICLVFDCNSDDASHGRSLFHSANMDSTVAGRACAQRSYSSAIVFARRRRICSSRHDLAGVRGLSGVTRNCRHSNSHFDGRLLAFRLDGWGDQTKNQGTMLAACRTQLFARTNSVLTPIRLNAVTKERKKLRRTRRFVLLCCASVPAAPLYYCSRRSLAVGYFLSCSNSVHSE